MLVEKNVLQNASRCYCIIVYSGYGGCREDTISKDWLEKRFENERIWDWIYFLRCVSSQNSCNVPILFPKDRVSTPVFNDEKFMFVASEFENMVDFFE